MDILQYVFRTGMAFYFLLILSVPIGFSDVPQINSVSDWRSAAKRIRSYEAAVQKIIEKPGERREIRGRIAFVRPNKWALNLEITEQDGSHQSSGSSTRIEKWVFDGRTLYVTDPKSRTLVKRLLPPTENIVLAGIPVELLFGTDGGKVESEYSWSIHHQKLSTNKPGVAVPVVRLHGWRMFESPPAYERVGLVVNASTMLPFMLSMHLPKPVAYTEPNYHMVSLLMSSGKEEHINTLDADDPRFSEPKVPSDWRVITEPPPKESTSPKCRMRECHKRCHWHLFRRRN